MHTVLVALPAYNEEKSIVQTIDEINSTFMKNDGLFDMKIVVFNNNSTDKTFHLASTLLGPDGVVNVRRRGKGEVVKSIFSYARKKNFDYLFMVDADATYCVDTLFDNLKTCVDDDVDMLIGDRISCGSYDKQDNPRALHSFGNRLITNFINSNFSSSICDALSGYRIFSRYFIENFRPKSRGFEIEVEMTMFALYNEFCIVEKCIGYKDRKNGSVSKLNTFSDGFRIVNTIFLATRYFYPMRFFGYISMILLFIGFSIGSMPIYEFVRYGYVYKVPSAILASGIVILSFMFFFSGLIISTVIENNERNVR